MFDTHTVTEDDGEGEPLKVKVYYYDEEEEIDRFIDRLSEVQYHQFYSFAHRPK
jgi:predicted RNA-binding protein with PIN domain